MKNWIYGIWSKFLDWFGKIKVMTFGGLPVLATARPYYVTGYSIVELMEMLKPGDVLIRGYDDYLDGKFIPDKLGYSHAGLYVGKNEVVHSASPCVQTIHLIDFCQADRIMALRPDSGQPDALEKSTEFLGVPYDFNYESDIGKLYCFELIAKCYPQFNLKEYDVEKLGGLIRRKCYLAKSIYENSHFTKLLERNKKGSAE